MEKAIGDFIEFICTEREASKNTVMAYKRDIEGFARFMLLYEVEKPEKINKTNIMAYLLELQKKGKSVATISRNIASLRMFFQHLFETNTINSNPAIDIEVPKVERKIPEILTLDEVEMLLEQPDITDIKGIRDKAILELLYATGIKVTELTSLKLQDINLSLGYIRCACCGKERFIPLGSKAINSLKAYLDKARGYMIKQDDEKAFFVNCSGFAMTRQGLWKTIKNYAKKCDIYENISPNILRHSFAAHMVANGADLQSVQEMMGHGSISTTQIYVQVNKTKLKDVYLKSHPRA